MVRMVARLCAVLLCLPVAFLDGCGQATSPLGAVADAGTNGDSVATGGSPGGVSGGSGGTGGQLAAPTSATPPLCVPGASVACACVTGQQGAQVCTSAGVFGACVCWAPTMDAASAVGSDDAATSPPDASTAVGGSGGSAITGGVRATGGSGPGSSGGTVGSAAGVAGVGGGGSGGTAGNGHSSGGATGYISGSFVPSTATGGTTTAGSASATGGTRATSPMTLAQACARNCALASGLATCSTTTTVCEQSCMTTFDNTAAVSPDLGRQYTVMMVCVATSSQFASSADFVCAKPNSPLNKWSPGPYSDCEQLICDWNCNDGTHGNMDPWVDIRCYCSVT